MKGSVFPKTKQKCFGSIFSKTKVSVPLHPYIDKTPGGAGSWARQVCGNHSLDFAGAQGVHKIQYSNFINRALDCCPSYLCLFSLIGKACAGLLGSDYEVE